MNGDQKLSRALVSKHFPLQFHSYVLGHLGEVVLVVNIRLHKQRTRKMISRRSQNTNCLTAICLGVATKETANSNRI